ncbi:uncharacterized protein BJX67DRAFT_339612 [Aspergillus lucknowensis]|uniref:Uncharacterized protein n=1 Tax=Aspergillus lucknowensis TaxID=176173 RepID=A0ABR4M790_9EURO
MAHGGLSHGGPLVSTNVSETIFKHDWHGIFSLDLSIAVGGILFNPFANLDYTTIDYTTESRQ